MHSPERILEALAWLYGAADIQDANNDSGFGVPINDRLAHARAAYLTWMRGRLALRGIEKEGGAKHVG